MQAIIILQLDTLVRWVIRADSARVTPGGVAYQAARRGAASRRSDIPA
jgi:hypothetical protein